MLLRLVPEKTDIKFLSLRKAAYVFSIALIIGSMALFFVKGLNYGIDFKGGVNLYMKSEAGAVDIAKARAAITGTVSGELKVKEFGSPTDIVVAIEQQEGGAEAQNEALRTVQSALENAMPNLKFQSSEVIGPQVSGELKRDGIIAVSVAVFMVLIYIWFRFEWQFGLGAIIALVHDVLITVGFFALTGIEFNLSIIAAILTIVGYSLNDTVVVYDRVRENIRKYRKKELDEVIDLSLNQTLARTIMTSVTTLIALFSLFFLGGESVRGFTDAMIWGVLIGTYSSLFVAAPALMFLKLERESLILEEDKKDPTVDKSKLTPFDHL